MADPLGVTPDGLRVIAKDLRDVSSVVHQVLSWFFDKFDADGSAWGQESMGHSDSDLAQVDYVKQGIEAKTALLDGYSSGVRTAADMVERLG